MKIKRLSPIIWFVLFGYNISLAQVVPTLNTNSIVTYTPVDPTTTVTQLKSIAVERQGINIQYIDGLGRPMQTVSVKSTPGLKDMVQPVVYDDYGRESEKYLPYEAPDGTSGSYRPLWSDPQKTFYNNLYTNEGEYAKSFTQFEDSPLNRMIWSRGPGNDWKPSATDINGKVSSITYGTNITDEVRLYKVTDDGTLQFNGYYAAGTLTLLETKDEDSRVVQEWKDLAGQVILKRTYTLINKGGETVETYYVYDDMGRLRAVLPPLAAKEQIDGIKVRWLTSDRDFPTLDQGINTYVAEEGSSISLKPGFTFTATPGNSLNFKVTSGLVYRYEYDERGRVIEKKIPGADRTFMVYDQLDRTVLEQDGDTRKANASQWIAHTYDVFGRELKKGLVTITGVTNTQAAIQTWFNANQTGLDALISSGTLLVQSWYDSYNGLPTAFADVEYMCFAPYYCPGYTLQTNGLLTAQEVRVLNPEVGKPATLKTKFYYDKVKKRLIQSRTQLYDGGTSIQFYVYNFWGQVIQEMLSLSDLSVERRYSYDHTGRVTLVEQSVNSGTWVKGVTNEYDALGQSTTCKLGVDGTTSAQELNSSYNIRGWLIAINNPDALGTDLFAEKLSYQTQQLTAGIGDPAADPQHSGNITETLFAYRDGNPGAVKQMAYKYWYDGLNRLTDGRWYSTAWARDNSKYDTKYTYDLNGNIKTLSRYGISGTANALIDNLSYTYDGNRLLGVTDNSGKDEGYRDITKTTDFSYTANGSMSKDLDKGIDVTYNMLNLPQQVKETTGQLSVNYVYTATGAKLAALYLNGTTLTGGNRYIGPLVRRFDIGTSSWVNDYVTTAEGRLAYSGSTWIPEYFLKDHLGNVRSIVKRSATYSSATGWATQVWQGSYYPFGMPLGQSFVGESNQLGYNGKEMQDFALNGRSLDWLDYGARMYDPQIGRWHVIDPLAESMYDNTPYKYGMNNPLSYIDPDGRSENYVPDEWTYNIDTQTTDHISTFDGDETQYIKVVDDNGNDYGRTIIHGSRFSINQTGDNVAISGGMTRGGLENMSYTAQVYNFDISQTSITSMQPLTLSSLVKEGQYSIPVWGSCAQSCNAFARGEYFASSGHFLTAFAEMFTLGIGTEFKLGSSVTNTVTESRLWEVGAYKDFQGAEAGLEAHHVGQKALMKKFVPDYNLRTAPSILVPEIGHTSGSGCLSRMTSGITNARQVVARDVFELRRVYPNIPNSSLKQLIQMNKTMYPNAFIK